MPTSEVDICNKALSRIGHTKFIDAFRGAGDGSTEADVCNRSYDDCVDEVLSAFRWPFSTRRWLPAAISPSTLQNGVVPTGWSYAYPLPADLIGLTSIVPMGLATLNPVLPPSAIYGAIRTARADQRLPFTIEWDGLLQSQILLADASTPEWLYTARVNDPNQFDANFKNALEWRLAAELAPAIVKDLKKAEACMQAYNATLGDAVASAKRGVQPDQEPLPVWISQRLG